MYLSYTGRELRGTLAQMYQQLSNRKRERRIRNGTSHRNEKKRRQKRTGRSENRKPLQNIKKKKYVLNLPFFGIASQRRMANPLSLASPSLSHGEKKAEKKQAKKRKNPIKNTRGKNASYPVVPWGFSTQRFPSQFF